MLDEGEGVGPRYAYLPNQGSCQGPEGVKSRSLRVWVSGFKLSGLCRPGGRCLRPPPGLPGLDPRKSVIKPFDWYERKF